MVHRRAGASRLAIAWAAALALGLGGCPRDRTQPPGAPGTQPGRYAVRAQVVRVEPAVGGAVTVYLRHEPIDGFVDASGKRVGMASMVMPFQVPTGAMPQGLAPGDPVTIAFAVDWSGPTFRVERLERLAAGTALSF